MAGVLSVNQDGASRSRISLGSTSAGLKVRLEGIQTSLPANPVKSEVFFSDDRIWHVKQLFMSILSPSDKQLPVPARQDLAGDEH